MVQKVIAIPEDKEKEVFVRFRTLKAKEQIKQDAIHISDWSFLVVLMNNYEKVNE